MNLLVELAQDEIREDEVRPREQFIPQVSDQALPAAQVLAEQQHDPTAVTTSPRFIP